MKRSAAIGAVSLFSRSILSALSFPRKSVDISVVKGDDYLTITKKAIEILGGMEKFVKPGSKVAILANPQRNNPGSFTKPQVLQGAIQLCKESGAKEVTCLSLLPEANWESTGLKKVIEKENVNLKIIDRRDESMFTTVPIPKGKALKEARIMNAYFDYDVFLDIPVTKDHAGNKFTGTMKNLMGINSSNSNRTFHKENWTTDINAIEHLDQCIADLNTVAKPDLCIVDATEFITTNGPFGPGELLKPQKVVAGTDRVAIDSYCCTLWGLEAKDIIMINKAYEHGLGEMDLDKVNISEVQI
jgi:uncharacterized protein (DUF362 family)